MDLLKRNPLDAPAVPKLEFDRPLFKDGVLVGVTRRPAGSSPLERRHGEREPGK